MAPSPKAAQLMRAGMEQYQSGQLPDAEVTVGKLMKLMPKHPDVTHLAGAIKLGLGKPNAAIPLLEASLAVHSKQPMAWNSLGECRRILGEFDLAVDAYHKAIKLAPREAGFHNNLCVALVRAERPEEALVAGDAAIAAQPRLAMAHVNRANALVALGRQEDALESFDRALKYEPRNAQALNNKGNLLREVCRHKEAIQALTAYLKLKSDDPEVWAALGASQQELADYEQAEVSLRKAIALDPDNPQIYAHLSTLFLVTGAADKAVDVFKVATAREPRSVYGWRQLGHAYRSGGQYEEARDAYNRALACDPTDGASYRGLIDLDKVEAGSPLVDQMETMLATADAQAGDPGGTKASKAITDEVRVSLHLALGKAYDDTKAYEKAFDHYLLGNAVNDGLLTYDRDDTQRDFVRIKSVYNAAFFAERDPQASGVPDDRAPIFIVGMPRSGTTLVEQVLASHSSVFGAGELLDLGIMEGALNSEAGRVITADGAPMPPMPERAQIIPSAEWQDLGAEYIRRTRKLAGDEAPHVTDKMPHNFLRVGMIRAMLPNATIIHCTRSPVDNCLSIFKNHFSAAHGYASDLTKLGEYYRMYADLMAHWNAVLPGVMHAVPYEAMVSDVEGTTRALLDACHLPFEEACLNFHETKRAVNTLSVAQVRQPIYASSVKAYERYGTRVEPLIAALGDLHQTAQS